MKKRLYRKKNSEIIFSLGSFVLTLCCTFLLIVSTFVTVNIFYPSVGYNANSGEDFFKAFALIPQIPAVIFVGALLGKSLGITSVVLYILTGLFFLPVFALGGGMSYFAQYGFGYILAYIPAVWLLTTRINGIFSFKNVTLGVLYAVLTIHLTGIIYMTLIALIQGEGWNFIKGWIVYQSGLKILFDYMVSFALVYFVKAIQPILWCYRKPR